LKKIMNKKLVYLTLAAAGMVSAATAAPVTLYLTGSTAYRGSIYTALRNANGVSGGTLFDANGVNGSTADPSVLSPASTDSSGANKLVYHGFKNGVEYIINCAFTGSEAGIAAVAGTTIGNVRVPANFNGTGFPAALTSTFPLPGVPVKFLDPAATPAYSADATSTTLPDFAMADTGQSVSLTKSATLTDFGVVAIIPFTWAKNKNSAGSPRSSWANLTGVQHNTLFSFMAGGKVAAFFTGNSGDTDNVFLVGRNKGSGTRVNTMTDTLYYPSTPVQNCVLAAYDLGTGVLTFFGDSANTGQPTVSAGNPKAFADADVKQAPSGDGMDSGGFVAQELQCDGSGATKVLVGYLGIGDAKTARDGKGNAANPGGAVWLTLDGVAESNGAIEQGQYSFWGHEHLFAQQTPSSDAATLGPLLKTALLNAAGTLGSVAANQDSAIGTSFMGTTDKGDTGWPSR
jgi:hypothetical protein